MTIFLQKIWGLVDKRMSYFDEDGADISKALLAKIYEFKRVPNLKILPKWEYCY